MKDFWLNHYDKLISILLSTVIAGLLGYFAGIRAIDAKVANLDTKIQVLQTKHDQLKPNVDKIGDMTFLDADLKRRIELLELSDRAVTIFQLNLESKLRESQEDTSRTLKEMVDRLTTNAHKQNE